MREDVVALYVDRLGCYPRLVAEWYDEVRGAENYAGTLPVVAHPPCGPWGRLKHLNKYQRPEHALRAVEIVRRVGGVLEHPAESSLWKTVGLPPPDRADVFGGWTMEVEQVRWGHVARKRTWLYVVGPQVAPAIPEPREPTHWCSGGRRKRGPGKGRQVCVPKDVLVCSAEQRRHTPPAFAEFLLSLAAGCAK